MDIDVSIGKRIAQKRIEKGLSQEELAKLVNSTQALIAKIETGGRRVQVDLVVLLAEALDTDCDYLLRGVRTPFLDISESTGLSSQTIDKLQIYHNEAQILNNLRANAIPLVLETLLCNDEGVVLLSEIQDYLQCDYTHIYTDKVNAAGDGFIEYNGRIGFKANNNIRPYPDIYSFINPDKFEHAAIASITDEIKNLKKIVTSNHENKSSNKRQKKH